MGLLLLEHDLRCTLAVHAETLIRQLDDGAHGLAHGVEGVYFVQLLLWHLAAHGLIVLLQVQHEAQQATLCLITHLPRQGALLLWGLQRERRVAHRGLPWRGPGAAALWSERWGPGSGCPLSSQSAFSLLYALLALCNPDTVLDPDARSYA